MSSATVTPEVTAAPTGNLEITVSRAELLRELTAAQSVVERKTTIPILSNFLFEAADDKLTITATDLDQSLRTSCPAKVKKSGACTIPARKLYDYIRLLPEGDISIKLMDNHWVQIRAGRSNTKMVGMARANFPQVAEFPPTGVFRVAAASLKNMIAKTIFAISNEESRYTLNGALLVLKAESMAMVATDGHRLAHIEKTGENHSGVSGEKKTLIPRKALAELNSLLGAAGSDVEFIEFADDDQTLFFRIGSRVLTSRKLTGQFPNYEAVLPRDNTKFVIVRSEDLMASIQRVAQFADERSGAIKIRLEQNELKLSAQSSDSGESEDVIETPYNYDPLVVGFNSSYLIDFLRATGETGEVRLEFKDAQSAGQMRPEDANEDVKYRYIPDADANLRTARPGGLNIPPIMSSDAMKTTKDSPGMAESGFDFRLMVESIRHLAWRARPDGYITWYNERWYEYTGTTPSDMEGWGWQSSHHPETLAEVMAAWTESIRANKAFEMTFPLRGADGVFRPFLTRIVPFHDADGKVLHWFGTNTEITEQVETAEKLRSSEERFRIATQAVKGVMWTNDATGRMHGEQLAWSSFTGQKFDEYQGYGWASAVHPEDTRPTIDAWNEAVKESRLFSFEHRVRRQDGEYRLCSVRALPVLRADGGVREWVGVHTDITEDRRMHDALLRAEKLTVAGRLAATIAHEINNPLESVTNLLFLLEQTELTEEQKGYCSVAAGELRRVSEIANHTLRFHRQASGAARFPMEAMVASVLALFEGRLRSAHIEVQVRMEPGLVLAGFEGELRQVVANLVGNAIDAMAGKQGRKLLRLRGRERRDDAGRRWGAALTVADTGVGISAATATRLFEPFYTTKGSVGTGLGLWVSREIVSKHNGSLTMRSRQKPGYEGTVFRMFVPDA